MFSSPSQISGARIVVLNMFENFAREVFCLVSDSRVGNLIPSSLPPGDEAMGGVSVITNDS